MTNKNAVWILIGSLAMVHMDLGINNINEMTLAIGEALIDMCFDRDEHGVYIHTYIQYIHTYIQTDRQTDRLIDGPCIGAAIY